MVLMIVPVTAKKLPQTAPPPQSRGAARSAPGAGSRSGVDLNKAAGANGGQEACNC